VFSAHGVSEEVENSAKNRNLPIIDATCPLVTKVHKEAQRFENKQKQIILIGHSGHPEVEGTSGRVKNGVILISTTKDVENIQVKDPDNLAYVTQTTLSVDDTKEIVNALKKCFPNIMGPDLRDICYATQNRQDAVKSLAKKVDVLLVVGAQNSSNSNRLRDLGEEMGTLSYLINGPEDIDKKWFDNIENVGITAGASAPEILVDQVIDFLKEFKQVEVSIMDGKIEKTKFKLPPEIQQKLSAA